MPTLSESRTYPVALDEAFARVLAWPLPEIFDRRFLAIPPILAGAYAGVSEVDPAARDAAKGMGMTGGQVFGRVELPNALPLIFSGLRSATLQVIATTSVASYLGLGGLGRYLFDALAVQDYVTMLAGAVLIAVLALPCDGLLLLVQRILTPAGLRARG